jgi:hypothetical protein
MPRESLPAALVLVKRTMSMSGRAGRGRRKQDGHANFSTADYYVCFFNDKGAAVKRSSFLYSHGVFAIVRGGAGGAA